MKSTLIGILIGIAVMVGVGMVRADNGHDVWSQTVLRVHTDSNDWTVDVFKFQDGNTVCYLTHVYVGNSISCVRTK